MNDTITTPTTDGQAPTNSYTVHVYREIRLRFDGIAARSPEEAADAACDMHFDDATEWSDCEGESLSALVDVEGDEEFKQSRIIDFEQGRLLKVAPKLLRMLDVLVQVHTALGELNQVPSTNSDILKEANAVLTEAKGLAA